MNLGGPLDAEKLAAAVLLYIFNIGLSVSLVVLFIANMLCALLSAVLSVYRGALIREQLAGAWPGLIEESTGICSGNKEIFTNKSAAQAEGADPSQCNFTNSQIPPFTQNPCNFGTNDTIWISLEI